MKADFSEVQIENPVAGKNNRVWSPEIAVGNKQGAYVINFVHRGIYKCTLCGVKRKCAACNTQGVDF